jgi:hypothetical protein
MSFASTSLPKALSRANGILEVQVGAIHDYRDIAGTNQYAVTATLADDAGNQYLTTRSRFVKNAEGGFNIYLTFALPDAAPAGRVHLNLKLSINGSVSGMLGDFDLPDAQPAPVAPQPTLTNLRGTFLSRTHDTIQIKITFHDNDPPAPGSDVLYAASLLVNPGVVADGAYFGYQTDSIWSANADGDIDVIVTIQSAAFADDQAYSVWTLEAWRQVTVNGEAAPGPLVFGNTDLVIPPVGGFPAPAPEPPAPTDPTATIVIDVAPVEFTSTPSDAPATGDPAPTPAAPLPLTRDTLRSLFGDAYDAWAAGRASTGDLLADVRSFLADHPDATATAQLITIDATSPAWNLKKVRIKRVTLSA